MTDRLDDRERGDGRAPREREAGARRLRAEGLTAVRASEDGPAVVLDGVSLTVAGGEVVDVGGPSGAGKSTLLLALARLMPGATGELVLDGVSASDIEPREWRRRVAYVPQTPALLVGTVRDALLAPWTLRARESETAPDETALRRALEALGLDGLSPAREAHRLSVGQAARLGQARALLSAPDVLLLDEPDASLDDEAAGLASAAVRSFADAGGAVLRVRHRAAGDLADRRLVLSGGALEEVRRD